jgi:phosphinothricin acetyltransferase
MTGARMKIVPAEFERHALQMLDLLNDAVLHTTWVYDCDPHPEPYMREYFDSHAEGNYPVLAAESDNGAFLGFASCGPYRHHQGYLHAAELSVYVMPSARRTGVGMALMAALEEESRRRGIHTLIGVIDAGNLPSIAFHRKCGYEYAGTIREAGWKFGRWLSIVYYQKIL